MSGLHVGKCGIEMDAQDSIIVHHSVRRRDCSGFAIFISSWTACLWVLFPLRGGYNSNLVHVTCYFFRKRH